ncbi:MAG: alpha/beta fold hydrolase [Hyphomicrobiales bacterium]
MSTPANPEIGRFIDVGGLRTNVHDIGSGQPVVMIHGSGPGVSAYANWRLTMPALAEKFRVIAPDVIGFGYTDYPENLGFDLDMWVEHFLGLMDALEVDKVDIIGNSFGGALALHVARRRPERVRRMVLMGSAAISFPLTDGLDAVWGYEPGVPQMRRLLDIFAYNRALVTDELAEVRYRASIREGVQEAFSALFPAPRQRWVDALALSEAELKEIPHPALVVHGREDKVIPPEASVRIFNLLPDARLHMFGRCGHWTQIEHAAAFNRLIIDFLGGADGAI